MVTIRKSAERGHANHGWLDSYHTFSFANYYDPAFMGFRHLRVINEDRVEGSQGFGKHPHRDMEIITYIVSGALEHQDSMGNREVIRAGEVQVMSAGTGITHSEYNASATEPVHLLQIWILPDQQGIKPRYDQKMYSADEKRDRLRLIASPEGREGSVMIHQNVNLYASLLDAGKQLEYSFEPNRHGWLQVVKGAIALNGQLLTVGDGAAVSHENQIAIAAQEDSEFLLFDLA